MKTTKKAAKKVAKEETPKKEAEARLSYRVAKVPADGCLKIRSLRCFPGAVIEVEPSKADALNNQLSGALVLQGL